MLAHFPIWNGFRLEKRTVTNEVFRSQLMSISLFKMANDSSATFALSESSSTGSCSHLSNSIVDKVLLHLCEPLEELKRQIALLRPFLRRNFYFGIILTPTSFFCQSRVLCTLLKAQTMRFYGDSMLLTDRVSRLATFRWSTYAVLYLRSGPRLTRNRNANTTTGTPSTPIQLNTHIETITAHITLLANAAPHVLYYRDSIYMPYVGTVRTSNTQSVSIAQLQSLVVGLGPF